MTTHDEPTLFTNEVIVITWSNIFLRQYPSSPLLIHSFSRRLESVFAGRTHEFTFRDCDTQSIHII